ncbi:hypothetical protein [Alkalimarinus coralli]|uniref:hypothetical protein n=1 Tax=Alkalimarinus coralli TaxID=2935863 RepID=UPI00202B272D|nr:hypothetical protein [Alkalimarinus coralli]
MKRLVMLSQLFLLSSCSLVEQAHLDIPAVTGQYELPLKVTEQDKLLIGDFMLVRNTEGYTSLVVASSLEEAKLYGLDAVSLVKQLYGFDTPKNEEIARARKAVLAGVSEHRAIAHEELIAFYLKDNSGVERIYYAEPESATTYYLIESEGGDAESIFKGIRRR